MIGQVPAAARSMVERCEAELLAAQFSTEPSDRFLHAHFAALRAAGAVLEASGGARVRGRSANAWDQLSRHAPELASWSARFAQSARVRGALEAGRLDLVDDDRAEDLLCAAEDFRDAVCVWLGIEQPAQTPSARAS